MSNNIILLLAFNSFARRKRRFKWLPTKQTVVHHFPSRFESLFNSNSHLNYLFCFDPGWDGWIRQEFIGHHHHGAKRLAINGSTSV
jgi:hypothetical protein